MTEKPRSLSADRGVMKFRDDVQANCHYAIPTCIQVKVNLWDCITNKSTQDVHRPGLIYVSKVELF